MFCMFKKIGSLLVAVMMAVSISSATLPSTCSAEIYNRTNCSDEDLNSMFWGYIAGVWLDEAGHEVVLNSDNVRLDHVGKVDPDNDRCLMIAFVDMEWGAGCAMSLKRENGYLIVDISRRGNSHKMVKIDG